MTTEFISISQAKQLKNGVNVRGTIKSKGEIRVVNLKSGGTIDVCDTVLSNGDGAENEIGLTLWGDDIGTCNIGDKVEIINGYTNVFKGTISLGKGKFGQLNKTQ